MLPKICVADEHSKFAVIASICTSIQVSPSYFKTLCLTPRCIWRLSTEEDGAAGVPQDADHAAEGAARATLRVAGQEARDPPGIRRFQGGIGCFSQVLMWPIAGGQQDPGCFVDGRKC